MASRSSRIVLVIWWVEFGGKILSEARRKILCHWVQSLEPVLNPNGWDGLRMFTKQVPYCIMLSEAGSCWKMGRDSRSKVLKNVERF